MKKLLLLMLLPAVAFAQSHQLTKADKIYGLSKFWQEVNYNFVYLNKIDRNKWDSTYKALIISIPETKTDYEYYHEMQRFCATLKDGHTNVNMPAGKDFEPLTTMFGNYRLFIENVEDKAIITRVNFSKKDEIPVGSEVIEVNGIPTAKYIAEYVAPYISSSTDYGLKDWSRSNLLQGLEGSQFEIKIKKPKGQILSLKLTHQHTEEKEVFPAFSSSLLDFKWYPNNVAYIALNSFVEAKIDSLFISKLPELYKAKGIIVDLRKNGGGDTWVGSYILKYLTNDSLLYGARYSTRQLNSAFKAWGKYTSTKDTVNSEWNKKALLTYQDNYFYDFDYHPLKNDLSAKRIVVPTVLLIGHHTASAAEDFLIYADNQKHMTKIGRNSCGSTGQPYWFDLPGGGSARVCTKKDTYPDGREFVGYGIKPDIEIIPTVKDFIANKDATLNTAVNYLNKKIK
ncbi:C-terminal processing protease CtpA/Prc [Pedobacter psychrotolerans]|uniref:C-terminal processing protease CtpA/Prc n=2 Tax=Pedobacter psychrotolerans TaxID=1843235 RepID=A0A4R2HIF8_9SPHI|nr:S41 family peptidase [Pedobacter psychrotolerans]TCO26713.1 C-terminal processing protease CtpA/Prc [Pedobacter psychrotolerans]